MVCSKFGEFEEKVNNFEEDETSVAELSRDLESAHEIRNLKEEVRKRPFKIMLSSRKLDPGKLKRAKRSALSAKPLVLPPQRFRGISRANISSPAQMSFMNISKIARFTH